ncbi:MAG: hypothetical protein PF904_18650 [Kiritimatiellae bacterium]|jgi:amino acid transporter|nr:hypothetical protein [Kiritimatiellia bacterium]
MADKKKSEHTGNGFSTFSGVFTPSILTILGVILFMRANFVVGEAGIYGAIIILVVAQSITALSALSICAISTNMSIRGGGAYFMISRVLGPEFGGAIGLALFIAQGLSIPFYILGFAEVLVTAIPTLSPWFLVITLSTAAALFLLAYVGAKYAMKVQYVIMAVLALAIFFMFAGAARHFDSQRLKEQLRPPEVSTVIGGKFSEGTAGMKANVADFQARATGRTDTPPVAKREKRYSFWILFAIYFPAVTGILTGVNMSGDLKDPMRSIPRGTLMAVAVGFIIYAAQIVICGGSFSRADLINRPFETLSANALFGWGWLVVAGVVAASLSSALGSMLGAPRVLQAVARDNIVRRLRPLAKGTKENDEPRNAMFVALALTVGILVWAGNKSDGGALNSVAAVTTMFFLWTYGMINVAAFTEHLGSNPSFRPTFKYFHWTTALLGAVSCLGVTLLISLPIAIAAAVLLSLLFWRLRCLTLKTNFGDARRGFYFELVRKNMLRLAESKEDSRNWRPTMLVIASDPEQKEDLLSYAVWLQGGRGMVYISQILQGEIQKLNRLRLMADRRLVEFCESKDIQAFPLSIVAPDLISGANAVLQTATFGPVRPNLICTSWHSELLQQFESFRWVIEGQASWVIAKIDHLPNHNPMIKKRIDIWWRGRRNGALMAVMAHLLSSNWEWDNAEVRLLRLISNKEGAESVRTAFQQLLDDVRIEATPTPVVSERTFNEVVQSHSSDATCVILGFDFPDDVSSWVAKVTQTIAPLPTTLLVCAGEAVSPLEEMEPRERRQ